MTHADSKRKYRGLLLALVLSLTLAASQLSLAGAQRPGPPQLSPDQTQQAYREFAERFFDGFFHFNPPSATQVGLHQYDAELPTYSRREIEAEAARSERALKSLRRIPRQALSRDDQIDARLLDATLRGYLLELENIRRWELDPDFYNQIISESIFSLVRRNFAPLEERLKALISRERRVPEILASASANVANPPAVYTHIAILQVTAEIGFLKDDLPKAVAGVQDITLKGEFDAVNRQAIEAYESFLHYLRADLALRSHGTFVLGTENYRRKLLYDEMVDTPPEELLRLGERELRKTQADFKATAALIDPRKTPAQVLAELSSDHPDSRDLLADTQALLSGLREFVTSHQIATILSPEIPRVVETPPFMRALSFASMDTPGPFDSSPEAFYNVTLPEPGWSDAQKEEHLRAFNRYALKVISIHEVFPGHYTQFLWQKRAPTRVRKLAGSVHQPWGEIGSNSEGWAHYAEQMMLEQGYGEGDPRLRLLQLHEALIRLCRYVVSVRMHTCAMNLQEATDFFKNEGYMEPVNAEREAMRGASDPTYLVYTLGKLEILKLREDYRRKVGSRFSLKEFHDRFLSFGNVPIKLIREEMLGNDSQRH